MMHKSFGMESRRKPVKTWAEAMRGPSRADVLRHVRKICNYQALTAGPIKAR
jgi:hypothetical protein